MSKLYSSRTLILIVVGLLGVGVFGCNKDEALSDGALANQQFYLL